MIRMKVINHPKLLEPRLAKYLNAQGLSMTPLPTQVDQVDSKIKVMGYFYMIKEEFINNPYF